MPTYDVKCEKCQTEDEIVLGINDEVPECDLPAGPQDPGTLRVCGGKRKKLLCAVPGRVQGGTPRHYR